MQGHIKYKLYKLLATVLIVLLIQWSFNYPNWIEKLYTERLFFWLSSFLGFVSGLFPFAIGELVYIILVILLIINLVQYFVHTKYALHSGYFWADLTLSVGVLISKWYIIFMFLWGWNYYTMDPLSKFQLKVKSNYSYQEVDSLSLALLKDMNGSRNALTDSQIINYQLDRTEKTIKLALFPSLGDKMGYLAFYQPLTGEAIIRNDLPKLLLPFTLEHEKAHQLGYASETVANFMAYLKAIDSKDRLLQYSMQLQLFSYAQNASLAIIAKAGDYALWKKVIERNKHLMDPKVLADRKAIKAFFASKQRERIPGTDALYDQFLKWNQQSKGLESYDQVIQWVLAYQQAKKLSFRTDSSTSYSL